MSSESVLVYPGEKARWAGEWVTVGDPFAGGTIKWLVLEFGALQAEARGLTIYTYEADCVRSSGERVAWHHLSRANGAQQRACRFCGAAFNAG